jgi:hypothetical protein
MILRFVMFTFWNYFVLKLLRLETFTFSDATLNNLNVVLYYVFIAVPGERLGAKSYNSEKAWYSMNTVSQFSLVNMSGAQQSVLFFLVYCGSCGNE